eukprot:6231301-Pyramimonas_sp.AAC.2
MEFQGLRSPSRFETVDGDANVVPEALATLSESLFQTPIDRSRDNPSSLELTRLGSKRSPSFFPSQLDRSWCGDKSGICCVILRHILNTSIR